MKRDKYNQGGKTLHKNVMGAEASLNLSPTGTAKARASMPLGKNTVISREQYKDLVTGKSGYENQVTYRPKKNLEFKLVDRRGYKGAEVNYKF
tara:strand:- start:288 stop:566 length:279 start_codon:yes stop_codon:yes gene_type:complete